MNEYYFERSEKKGSAEQREAGSYLSLLEYRSEGGNTYLNKKTAGILYFPQKSIIDLDYFHFSVRNGKRWVIIE